jgi:hypothetical protein
MLITTIDQVREMVGNAIRKENTYELLKPYLLQVEENLITGLLGPAQLAALAGASGEKPERLRKLVQQAIVWNGYLEAWYHTMYELGGTGINRQKPKDTEALFRYQEENVRKDIVQKADRAIEDVMLFLMANADDFPDWKESDEYQQNFEYILSNPAALQTSLPEVTRSYRMYLVLRNYMHRVERNTLRVIMGPALFAWLKGQLADGADMDTHDLELLDLARDVVAPATLLEAMPFIRVQFSTTGVRVMTTMNNIQDETPVTDEQTQWLMGILRDRTDQAKAQLRKFLNETASADVFPLYFTSGLYVAPGSRQWKLPDNENKRHFRL